ncbi:hypothetical protein KIPB_017312, partial [Kipferlia bialata]
DSVVKTANELALVYTEREQTMAMSMHALLQVLYSSVKHARKVRDIIRSEIDALKAGKTHPKI